MSDPERRAGDDDRLRTSDVLRDHYAAGRLDAAELDDRLERVWHARTIGDLEQLTADMPEQERYELPVPAAARALPRRSGADDPRFLRVQLVTFVTVAILLLSGWAMSGFPDEPYPAYVLLAWGAAIAAQLIGRGGR